MTLQLRCQIVLLGLLLTGTPYSLQASEPANLRELLGIPVEVWGVSVTDKGGKSEREIDVRIDDPTQIDSFLQKCALIPLQPITPAQDSSLSSEIEKDSSAVRLECAVPVTRKSGKGTRSILIMGTSRLLIIRNMEDGRQVFKANANFDEIFRRFGTPIVYDKCLKDLIGSPSVIRGSGFVDGGMGPKRVKLNFDGEEKIQTLLKECGQIWMRRLAPKEAAPFFNKDISVDAPPCFFSLEWAARRDSDESDPKSLTIVGGNYVVVGKAVYQAKDDIGEMLLKYSDSVN